METRNVIDDRSYRDVRSNLQTRLLDWYVNTTGVPPTDKDPRDLPPFYPTPSFPNAEAAKVRALDL